MTRRSGRLGRAHRRPHPRAPLAQLTKSCQAGTHPALTRRTPDSLWHPLKFLTQSQTDIHLPRPYRCRKLRPNLKVCIWQTCK